MYLADCGAMPRGETHHGLPSLASLGRTRLPGFRSSYSHSFFPAAVRPPRLNAAARFSSFVDWKLHKCKMAVKYRRPD